MDPCMSPQCISSERGTRLNKNLLLTALLPRTGENSIYCRQLPRGAGHLSTPATRHLYSDVSQCAHAASVGSPTPALGAGRETPLPP